MAKFWYDKEQLEPEEVLENFRDYTNYDKTSISDVDKENEMVTIDYYYPRTEEICSTRISLVKSTLKGDYELPETPSDSEINNLVLLDFRAHYPSVVLKVSDDELEFLEDISDFSDLCDIKRSFSDISQWIVDIQEEDRRVADVPQFVAYT